MPLGTSPEDAAKHIKLVMLMNDVSLRNLNLRELEKGFGLYLSKPIAGFSPAVAELLKDAKFRPADLVFDDALTLDLGLHDLIGLGRSIYTLLDRALIAHAQQAVFEKFRQGKVFQIESADSGRTWGTISLTTLPNPNSGTDAVTLKDGRHLLIYNHTGKGRSPLNLAVLRDGQTWQAAGELENTPGNEFSYPAIIQTRDGLVHATWTWKRQKVRHAIIDPAKLTPRDFMNGEWPK